jgi:hypothetical protein
MMNQILASVIALNKSRRSPDLEELAKYLICDKKDFTRANLHTVYYIENYVRDVKVCQAVKAAKYKLVYTKESSTYFPSV